MNDTTLNQYAAPIAEVADVAPPTAAAELRLFSAQGRIGRLRYLAYSTGASVLYNIALGLLVFSFGEGTTGAMIGVVLPILALIWFSVITGIKRCHDIDISGWWTLTVIIPVIAFVWLFVPGSKGANRFGPPPPPNTWGVRLLGAILPLVFLVGMLAAIAIPSYQGYVSKARAAQQAPAQP